MPTKFPKIAANADNRASQRHSLPNCRSKDPLTLGQDRKVAQSSPSSLGLSTLLGAALMLAPPGLWAEQDHTASQPGAQPVPASDQKGHALTPADARLHELVTQIEAEHNTIPHVRMEAVAARGENVVLIDVREAGSPTSLVRSISAQNQRY